MKKNKYFFLLLFLLIPTLLFSQSSTDYEKAVEFLQGGNILEDWFMKAFLKDYKSLIMSQWSSYTDIARLIGGVAAMVYFGQKSFEMMTGGKWEIMPLLRPFGLLMVIIYWSSFVNFISIPFDLLANKSSKQYEASVGNINQLRAQRHKMQMQMIDGMFDYSADNEIAAEQGKKGWFDTAVDAIGDAVDKAIDVVVKPIVKLKQKFNISLQLVMTQLLELLALWILRLCVYGIFLIQMVYSGVLIILGPIAVSFSIFPAFKDSLNTWIARFISVQFYVTVAFIILTVTSTLQDFALTAEIQRYSEIIDSSGNIIDVQKMMFINSNGILSFGTVIVSFLVSAIAILTTPTVSTWIVSSTGLGGAVNTMSRAGRAVATGGKSILLK